ncbi:MAG: heliorhodopsin HeR [Acholeplasmataceae bacterium]|jgi:hypothetical protein|nr:heliorhodopsin HeR [Acholeplasmataceae bacterium]
MENMQFQKLRRFNMMMGAFHLVQGLLMIVFAITVLGDINPAFKITITQNFLNYDVVLQRLFLDQKALFDLPFGILVGVFLLLSAVAHALISFPKKINEMYNRDLLKGINKLRWFEYALSSSVMIVLIATLFGIYDIGSLILIFIVNAAMNLFGLDMEIINSKRSEGEKVHWGPFIWGSIAGIAPWVAIVFYMLGAGDVNPPWFVWAIVGTYFVAFNTFPINMILQYKKVGKWKDYLYGERTYIILSLVAKSILAWLVLFGALQPA